MSLAESFRPEAPVYTSMGRIMSTLTEEYNRGGTTGIEDFTAKTQLAQFADHIAPLDVRGGSAGVVIGHLDDAYAAIETYEVSLDRRDVFEAARQILGYAALLAHYRQSLSASTTHHILTIREMVVVSSLAMQRVNAARATEPEAVIASESMVRSASDIAIEAIGRAMTRPV